MAGIVKWWEQEDPKVWGLKNARGAFEIAYFPVARRIQFRVYRSENPNQPDWYFGNVTVNMNTQDQDIATMLRECADKMDEMESIRDA